MKALTWKSANRGYIPDLAIDLLCDLRKVTYLLCALVFSSVNQARWWEGEVVRLISFIIGKGFWDPQMEGDQYYYNIYFMIFVKC